jgi:catalase
VVLEGSFAPAPGAAALSKAVLFQGAAVPVTVRFSDATGLPNIPDGDPNANPHGLAIKFHLPDGSDMDMVTNSLPVFPVATISDFRDLLLAVAASGPGTPKPTPLDKFVATHPAVLKATEPTPASLATEVYNGIDAFILVDKSGGRHAFRYKIVPVGEVKHLDPGDAAKQQPDFLMQEIVQRVTAGPVRFRIMAQMAEPDDKLTDPTVAWPESRKLEQLGTLTIDKPVADSDTAQKALLFMPTALTDGVETSDDPLINSRSGAYAESFSRRSQ